MNEGTEYGSGIIKTIYLLLARFVIILLSLAQSCICQNSVATLRSVFSGLNHPQI